jgi:rhodanese-related sulfurtransferase
VLLDVREPWEFEICHLEGALPMPMASVPARVGELDPAREIVVICHHGGRSAQVGMFLERQGFARVINLAGGVAEWAARVDPAMAQY